MAQAIIRGLIASGLNPEKIFASSRTEASQKKVAAEFGILSGTNREAVNGADIVILAVKPQVLRSVCEDLRPCTRSDSLIISVAAGITCQTLQAWLGDLAIVRSMPNTPSALGVGASGLYANGRVGVAEKEMAQSILGAVGLALYVEEETQIDAVTAISGSGPAYFFLFIEAMIDAGVKLGLSRSDAVRLTNQTALGAASLASQSELDIQQLRKNVTSPNGTTERAIQSFEASELRKIVEQAMRACSERAQELAIELGAK